MFKLFKKFCLLIAVFFINNRRYQYLKRYYLNKSIDIKKAKPIRVKNDKDYENMGIERFIVETYDGSNQYTHPDIVLWRDALFLVLTPYPYGIESYENPSLYKLDNRLKKIEFSNPIASLNDVKRRNHLSDPFFCPSDNCLLILYRKNVIVDYIEQVSIEFVVLDNSYNLLPSRVLISGKEDMLSPIMYKSDSSFFLQYINRIGNVSEVVEKQFDNQLKQTNSQIVNMVGFPDGFYLWHFGIDHNTNKTIKGLLLLREIQSDNHFILCESVFEKTLHSWIYVKTVAIPDYLDKTIGHIYKSCYLPNTNKVLLSFRDKRFRYYSSFIELK